eukprot:m.246705 g.246705  ORF g.246705 m.246705 type:complete len:171 (+) comp15856_c0_seq13:3515-4027(+)
MHGSKGRTRPNSSQGYSRGRVNVPVVHFVYAEGCSLQARRIIQVHQVPDRYFYVFGTNLARSSSTDFHNAGFQFCHLRHTCVSSETDSLSEVEKVIRSRTVSFGGAGVQHPLKDKVIKLCDSLSDAAREIGAVNTIVNLQSGRVGGHNTDWLGIIKPLKNADIVATPVRI